MIRLTSFSWQHVAPLLAACALACDDNSYPLPDYEKEPGPSALYDGGIKGDSTCEYGYGEPCDESVLSCENDPCIHGICIDGQDGQPDTCQCQAGYAGPRCRQCADDHIPSGLICIPGGPCADHPCIWGTCRLQDDGFFCECHLGYKGTLCDRCAAGYHAQDLQCVPDA